jgi:2-oxoglutarate ferredoxin oxidoreductase subunit gamma
VIAMNLPSMDKYEAMMVPGGYFVVNSSMVNREVKRKDLHVLMIPANEIAEELGIIKAANMVLLGGLVGNSGILRIDDLKKALHAHTPERLQKFIDKNIAALERGASYKASEPA